MRKLILFFAVLLFVTSCSTQKFSLNIGEQKIKDYYSEIDFELIRNKIIVPVSIQGEEYRFLFDTGAMNAISEELYNKLKPDTIRIFPLVDINQIKENKLIVSIDSLKIGDLNFEKIPTFVGEFTKKVPFSCMKIDGVIGSNMLKNSIIQIDGKKKKLIITDLKEKLNLKEKNSEGIMLTKIQSTPFVWVKLRGEDKGKEQLLIDTGADDIYSTSLKNYEKVFSKKEIFHQIGEDEGASSLGFMADKVTKHKNYKLLLPSLTINNIEFQNVISETIKSRNSLIGAKLLDYGIMTIDYLHKKFYFEPYSKEVINVEEPEFGFDKTLKDGKLIIGVVWDEDLKSKIKYADEILSINGRNVNDSMICDLVTNSLFKSYDSLTLKIKPENENPFELKVKKELASKNMK
ncbi:aspartyl protease family protein [Weeksellaceae bacterium TAE3-ERU29]|nr:aspartyl protease family protein [Weeksellaceae bacterium TAE3-ERU29]